MPDTKFPGAVWTGGAEGFIMQPVLRLAPGGAPVYR